MTTARYVFDFSEGDKDQKDLLGGKGANLAEMVKLGLPVPPGFTISTEACRAYLTSGAVPEGLDAEIAEHGGDGLWQHGARLRHRLTAPDGTVIDEGDVISVDGSSGLVYAGEVPVMAPPVVEYFEGSLDAEAAEADDLVRAVHRVMGGRTRCGGCGCGRTPTRSRTPSGRAGSAARASGCAAPSTCSWASGASTSSG